MSNICELCNITAVISAKKKYCDKCKPIMKRRHEEKSRLKKQERDRLVKSVEYEQNFYKVTTEPYTLTSKGFNILSEIKNKSYCQFFGDFTWVDIVEMYGKKEELYEYIKNEYVNYMNETGSQSLSRFARKYHKYITYDLIDVFGFDKIRIDCGIQKMRYSEQDFIDNFNEIKKALNKVPLYSEFHKHSRISLNTYAERYQLKSKVYDAVVKLFSTEQEYKCYLHEKSVHKTNVGKETGKLSVIFSVEDLENEFKRVFDECIAKFGINPPRRYFNKVSRFDDRTYRNRLGKSWTAVCEHYGYKVDRNHKSEKIVLDTISKLTSCSYSPQKTWEWLIGTGGKHMYCDGYFEEFNLVIEFDGVQHRKPIDAFGGNEKFLILQKNDALKEKLLSEIGIKLIRIDSRESWHQESHLAKKLMENGIPISITK